MKNNKPKTIEGLKRQYEKILEQIESNGSGKLTLKQLHEYYNLMRSTNDDFIIHVPKHGLIKWILLVGFRRGVDYWLQQIKRRKEIEK